MRGNRVLVQPDKAKTMSDGGLEIPIDAQEQQTVGVVRYVGKHPDVDDLAPGDRVAFGRYSGTPFSAAGVETGLVLLRGDDVIAALDPEVAHVEG